MSEKKKEKYYLICPFCHGVNWMRTKKIKKSSHCADCGQSFVLDEKRLNDILENVLERYQE